MSDLKALFNLYENYHRSQSWNGNPDSLYEPVRFVMEGQGKRFRPLLVMLGYSLYKSDPVAVLPLAYAYELFHNFSLVHDDIMDDAPLRRGKPTAYAKFGQTRAILSGDLMLVEVYDYLAKTPGIEIRQHIEVFNIAARLVCEGQQLDMDFEQTETIVLADYFKIIEGKTAALLAAALQAGALASGASRQDAENLYRFGMHMGRAFQIQDDYLDLYGDPEKVGKKPGGDVLRKKKTALYALALQLTDDTQKQAFIEIYNTPESYPGKVNAVKAIFEKLKVKEAIRTLIKNDLETALKHFHAVALEDSKKQPLHDFTMQFIARDY